MNDDREIDKYKGDDSDSQCEKDDSETDDDDI